MIVKIKQGNDYKIVYTKKVLEVRQQEIIKKYHGLKGLVFFRMAAEIIAE